jgi:hypothetical protein
VLRSVDTVRNYWLLKVQLAAGLPRVAFRAYLHRVAFRAYLQFVKNIVYGSWVSFQGRAQEERNGGGRCKDVESRNGPITWDEVRPLCACVPSGPDRVRAWVHIEWRVCLSVLV